MTSHFESNELPVLGVFSIQCGLTITKLLTLDKLKLLYHINKFIDIHRLCIPLSVVLDILVIAYGESHLGFSCCYKIIVYFQFISHFTKLSPFFYLILFLMPDTSNQASSSLWITSTYKISTSPFLYINARFYVCAPADQREI